MGRRRAPLQILNPIDRARALQTTSSDVHTGFSQTHDRFKRNSEARLIPLIEYLRLRVSTITRRRTVVSGIRSVENRNGGLEETSGTAV